MLLFRVFARRNRSYPHVAQTLTLDLSISYSAFCLAKKVKAFAIKQIQPHAPLAPPRSIFCPPLFSYSHELRFP